MPELVGNTARFLEDVKIPLRLSAVTPSGWPVVVSLWFLLRDGKLWCATQGEAKIAGYIRANPRCAFEVAPDQPPYRGVRGRGTAVLHKDRGEETLRMLLGRYLGGADSPLAKRLLANVDNEVAIEISAVSVHTWDYRKRMEKSIRS